MFKDALFNGFDHSLTESIYEEYVMKVCEEIDGTLDKYAEDIFDTL